MSNDKISRRSLLKGAIVGLAAVPAATLVAREASAQPFIAPSDPQAKSLGYVEDAKKVDPKTAPTYKAGQTCANCIQYVADAKIAGGGKCNIFPGKAVKAAGWCKVWVLKPGMKLG